MSDDSAGPVVQNFVYYVRQDIGTEVPCSEDGKEVLR